VTAIAFVGNAATAPELAYTPTQKPFVRLLVAENQGHRNRESGEWIEDEATFWPVTVWGDAALNIAESINKGDRVVVTGRTRTSTWTTAEGDKRSRVEVVADEVAASTRFARLRIAKVLKSEPSDSPAAPALAGAHAASGGSTGDAPF
jgi:single-strand DNA-binding protein